MSQQSVLLKLPDELYERVRQVAEESQRSVETVLLESLDLMFSQLSATTDLDSALSELASYSDDQLWGVVYRQMPWSQSTRLHELSARNKTSTLSPNEDTELQTLLEIVDRNMLLRSEALLLLKQRGNNIEQYLSKSSA